MQRLSTIRSRFFWKLYLSQSALFLLIVLTAGWFMYKAYEGSMTQNVKRSLQDKLAILAPEVVPIIVSNDASAAQERITDLAARIQIRVTLLDRDGRIFADSGADQTPIPHHLDSEEIREAEQTDVGYSIRGGETQGDEAMYMAKALYFQSERIGFLRVSLPITEVKSALQATRELFFITSLVGSLVALIVGLLLIKRATVPIREMMRVSEAMRQGRYDQKVQTLPSDEIGMLGDTLNRLGQAITEQIARISLDRAQLKTILANMVEGIIAIDHEDRIQFCNRAAYQLLQSNLTDCRGMKLETVDGFDRLSGLVEEARFVKGLAEEELRIRDEQTNRFLQCYASPLRGAETFGIIVVIHDISDVRKLEGIRRDFVTNVSHELKTPLTAIKGYTETLLSGALDDQVNARRFVEKIEANTDRLVTLVKDILALAQTEAESEQLKVAPVNWQDVVTEILSRHDEDITTKGLRISIHNESPDMEALGHREAMIQVLENLFTNAIRYTPQGGEIILTIFQENNLAWLSVKDTGIGIKQKHLERIFQRFYRVDKARSKGLGGTGLGLSIVQHLVNGMNGTISVESELGVGSVFKVCLPIAD